MAVSRVAVSNYKSFGDVDVALGNFTVLVGADGSGKSTRLDDLSARGLGGGFEARLTRIEAAVTSRLGVDLGAEP